MASHDLATFSLESLKVAPSVFTSSRHGGQLSSPPLLGSRLKSLDVHYFRPEEQFPQNKKNNKNSATEKVFPFWQKRNKNFIQRSLSRRIVELIKKRQLDAVLQLLQDAINKNIKPNRVVMNCAMAACVHCSNLSEAFLIYDRMLEPGGCGVDEVTYTILLKGLGESRMLDKAFEIVESMENGKAPGGIALTEVHVRTLLNAFAEAGDMLRARGVLTRYRSLVNRTGPSIFTYNILIKGYARSSAPLEALNLIDDINRLGLQPQRITFNALILACVRGEDLAKALHLLREMKEEAGRLKSPDLLPNIVTYTTLIQGFGQQGLFDGVISLVKELRASRDCPLDRVAYGVIIDAYIASGASSGLAEGLYLLKEMLDLAKANPELRPKAHVFLSLMRAYAANGKVDTVKMLQAEMVPVAGGPILPEHLSEADELLIEAAVNDGQLGLARQVLKSMKALTKGMALSNRAYLAVIRLNVLSNFGYNLFSPYVLQDQVSLEDPVEKWMLRVEDVKPPLSSVRLSNIVMRFFRDAIVPIVDESGTCVGVVHHEDCFELNASLGSIMRGPPPSAPTTTSIAKALSLLLEAEVKMVAILESRSNYGFAQNAKDKLVGFLTLERLLALKGECPQLFMNRRQKEFLLGKVQPVDVT